MSLNESIVEEATLEWFGELGYVVGHGPQIAPSEPTAAQYSFGEVVLVELLHEAIQRLNHWLHQPRTLSTLLDTLLPKLLSRELSVARIVHRGGDT